MFLSFLNSHFSILRTVGGIFGTILAVFKFSENYSVSRRLLVQSICVIALGCLSFVCYDGATTLSLEVAKSRELTIDEKRNMYRKLYFSYAFAALILLASIATLIFLFNKSL